MASIETKLDRHCPQKSWGYEEWIVNNDLYCGKRLVFNVFGKASSTSLHFHMKKHETMYVQQGVFDITTIDPQTAKHTVHRLSEGSSIVIEAGTVHRITAIEGAPAQICSKCGATENLFAVIAQQAVLLEFSTHHEDADSFRVER